jgi:hypothetical protein
MLSSARTCSQQADGAYSGEEVTTRHWVSVSQLHQISAGALILTVDTHCPILCRNPVSTCLMYAVMAEVAAILAVHRHSCPWQLQGLNPEEAERVTSSKGGRVELLEHDGYLSVAAGRFKGYQVGGSPRCKLL